MYASTFRKFVPSQFLYRIAKDGIQSIGILGGTERMDSTAIGDAVNLASRIEGMKDVRCTLVGE